LLTDPGIEGSTRLGGVCVIKRLRPPRSGAVT
jgi:hypothetical protein